MELVKVFVFEAVFVGALLGFEEGFLDYGGWRWRLFGDDFVSTEDVIPKRLCLVEVSERN